MHVILYSRSPPPENEEHILTKYYTSVQRMKCGQFLSLHIDERLDWHEHINECKEHPVLYTQLIQLTATFMCPPLKQLIMF